MAGGRSVGPMAPKAPKAGSGQLVDFDALSTAKDLLAKLQGSPLSAAAQVPQVQTAEGAPMPQPTGIRLPAMVDPSVLEDVTRTLAKAQALQGAAGFVPATAYSVKSGRMAGPLPGGPVWDAVRNLATLPLAKAQMQAGQRNTENQVLNTVAEKAATARGADTSEAMNLAQAAGAAGLKQHEEGIQAQQFATSQATTRRGQDMTLEAARLKEHAPAERLMRGRALASAASRALDELEGRIRTGKASAMSITVPGTDMRFGSTNGVSTMNDIGMLSNHLGQIAEMRGLRGKMQDEISKELSSAVTNKQAGLSTLRKWRQFVTDYQNELNANTSMSPAAPAQPFDPDSFLKGQ